MKRSLDRYISKRSFSSTPEPAPGELTDRHGPLLFVVQKHAARRLHYDFRLELDGVLKSWAVPKGPSLVVGDKRLAVETEDHPFEYASFEGVIPAGQYGAGNVIVWDCGIYSPDEDRQYSFDDRAAAEQRAREGLAQGKLSFFLRGEKLKGSFALVRTSTSKQWLLLKHKDRFAGADDLLGHSQSVLSGIELDEMSPQQAPDRLPAALLAPTGPAEKLPVSIKPMLAETGDRPRPHPDWVFEPKLDGYRVIAFIQNGTVRLQSRRGIDLTSFFPEIAADLQAQAVDRMVLDGEVVALGPDGRPSFNALQNRAQLKTPGEIVAAQRSAPAVFVCFDLLHFAGINLRSSPYGHRRRYLSQCLLVSSHIQLAHVATDGAQLYAAALDSGFEGVVAKRLNSVYQPGRRSPAWLKIKSVHTDEFLVGGYTRGKGEREPLGALLLGYWSGDELRYAGHVGSGLTSELIATLEPQIRSLTRETSPFAAEVPLHRPTTWLEPQLVVEVSFGEWTPDGLLRAPVFMRLRPDLEEAERKLPARTSLPTPAGANLPTPAGVSLPTPVGVSLPTPADEAAAILQQLDTNSKRVDLNIAGARIRLTNLDREYWPGDERMRQPPVTKRDFIRYLAAAARFMLPHLRDRPLTMIRMPEGIDGERFFQKHWEQALPDFVETVTVYSDHKEGRHRYLLANNLPTLLWLGQNGTLEFHVWHSRAHAGPDAATGATDYASSRASLEASVLNYPDYLVFDLDPYIYSGKEAKGAEPELNERGFAVGKQVAFWLRALLREMSLDALVKTSGKTGLHVFVPIERTVTFESARHICEMIGRHLMQAHPQDITLEWATGKRTGKIFIDYNMNVRGKTLNVAYSPRGVSGAPVSMPLTWEELETAEPMDFTIRNLPSRLEKTTDRWHDALAVKYSLARALGGDTSGSAG